MPGMFGRDEEGWSQGNYASITNEISHLWTDFQVTSGITNGFSIQMHSNFTVNRALHSLSQMIFMSTLEIIKTNIIGNIL